MPIYKRTAQGDWWAIPMDYDGEELVVENYTPRPAGQSQLAVCRFSHAPGHRWNVPYECIHGDLRIEVWRAARQAEQEES